MNRIAFELLKVAELLIAKKRPETLFEQDFFDLRNEIKDIMDKRAHKIAEKLKSEIASDLKAKGINFVSVEVKLGRFRGHHFITSSPVIIKADAKTANKVAEHLRGKFSPKFNVKKTENGISVINVR